MTPNFGGGGLLTWLFSLYLDGLHSSVNENGIKISTSKSEAVVLSQKRMDYPVRGW